MKTISRNALAFAVLALAGASASAQTGGLGQAFQAAWQRQPESRAADMRRTAVEARIDAAGNLLAAPPSLELANKTDRLNRNEGARELEIGLGLPLWLPGERSGTQALAAAERSALDSRIAAAQLRVAGKVRDAWWAAARAAVEEEVAQARLQHAERLATDVTRRVKAGNLSRADAHQADGAVATAAALLAEAHSTKAYAEQTLRALTGVSSPIATAPESMPASAVPTEDHPALRELADRAELARRNQALAGVQTRANPHLVLATTRERSSVTEPYGQTMTVGIRIPFGADNRHRARVASAEAEAIEADAQLALDRERLLAGIEAARLRVSASEAQLVAAQRRATLARETRGFFEKSFRFGESDLPTRLRVELEAFEADRQLARTRIDAAAAVSQLRQALGLLPE